MKYLILVGITLSLIGGSAEAARICYFDKENRPPIGTFIGVTESVSQNFFAPATGSALSFDGKAVSRYGSDAVYSNQKLSGFYKVTRIINRLPNCVAARPVTNFFQP